MYNEALSRSFNFPASWLMSRTEGKQNCFVGIKELYKHTVKMLSSVAERGSCFPNLEYVAHIYVDFSVRFRPFEIRGIYISIIHVHTYV